MAGTYQPVRESLREMNQLLIDSQQWDMQRREQQARLGLERMKMEADLQDRAQQRQIRALQAAQAQEQLTPKPVNLGNWIPNTPTNMAILHQKDGGKAALDLARMFGDNYSVNRATNEVLKPDGTPLFLNDVEIQKHLPKFMLLAERYNDPAYQAQQSFDHVQSQIKALDSDIKSLGKAPQFVAKRAELVQQRQALAQTLMRHEEQLSPEFLLRDYKRKYDNQLRMAMQANARNVSPTQAQFLRDAMQDTQERIKQLEKEILDSNKGMDADGGKNNLMKFAYLPDEDGLMTPGTGQWVNVPKNFPTGMKPENRDPKLKNYVWHEELSANQVRGSGAGKKYDDYTKDIVALHKEGLSWDKEAQMFAKPSDSIRHTMFTSLTPEFVNKIGTDKEDGKKYTKGDAYKDTLMVVEAYIERYFTTIMPYVAQLRDHKITEAQYKEIIRPINQEFMRLAGAVPTEDMLRQILVPE